MEERVKEQETPFFGTGFERSQYERRKQFGKVPEEESIPSEEAMENPEVFEGFENEEVK